MLFHQRSLPSHEIFSIWFHCLAFSLRHIDVSILSIVLCHLVNCRIVHSTVDAGWWAAGEWFMRNGSHSLAVATAVACVQRTNNFFFRSIVSSCALQKKQKAKHTRTSHSNANGWKWFRLIGIASKQKCDSPHNDTLNISISDAVPFRALLRSNPTNGNAWFNDGFQLKVISSILCWEVFCWRSRLSWLVFVYVAYDSENVFFFLFLLLFFSISINRRHGHTRREQCKPCNRFSRIYICHE